MKFFLVLPISLFVILTSKMEVSGSSLLNSVCKDFAAGELDAFKTLEALDLNIDDYSIGVNNTAKIFCS